jgi:hypothetical protein
MSSTSVWVQESPVSICASDEPVFAFTFVGATTVANPTAAIYINDNDSPTTGVNMPTGAAVATGNVVSTPVIKSLKGNNTYVLVIVATVDGVKTVRKCELRVQKDSAKN